MLSGHETGEGPFLVGGSSDIHSSVVNDTIVRENCFLHVRGNLLGNLTIEPGARRPSMDLPPIDITNLPDASAARLGQMVTLIGPEIGIDEFAAAAKSTGREVLSNLGSRFHRIYCAIGRQLPCQVKE